MSSTGQRRARIVDHLRQVGSASVAELVDRHGVSEMTIRRDLQALEDGGHLRRFRGGAIVDRRRSYEPPYLQREEERRDDKVRLAAAAAALVEPGDSVGLDYGTTMLEVARALAGIDELTVVTPNLRAALELAEPPGQRVLLAGGQVRPGELSVVGSDAERCFERYLVDRAFIGAAGLDVAHGLSDYNLEEVAVKRSMIRSAKQVVAIVDATKLGRVAFVTVATTAVLDLVITTAPDDAATVGDLRAAGVEVRCLSDHTSTPTGD